VDVGKLRDYCLNPEHPRGRHKARVFASALGLTADDADDLRAVLLAAAHVNEACVDRIDEYGRRYVLDFDVPGDEGSVRIRSSWIIREGEDFPRLTSCYAL